MTIPTELKNLKSELATLHHMLDIVKEMQQQNRQLQQQWEQLRQHMEQPQITEAKQREQRRKEILQNMAAIVRLTQSISSMERNLRVFENGMYIPYKTKVSLRTHPYNNFLLWIIIFFNQEHC